MLGTNCTTTAPKREVASSSATGSRCSPGGRIATTPPVDSGQNTSTAESSKLSVVLCSTASPGSRRYSACIHRIRLTQPPCVLATPLGMPVEPEV